MKEQERITATFLPRRTYTILRLDGRGFQNYCRGLERPFDAKFAADMDETAMAVCADASGVVFGYVQSDEISLLLTDFSSVGTQPWFDGKVQKIVSVSAARATATLNRLRPAAGAAMFDARVFTLADPVDVARYFIWRQRDCVRNSISMTAQAQFSHKSLHGMGSGQLQEKLWAEAGINWNDMPDGFKRGRWIIRESGPKNIMYTRRDTGKTISDVVTRTWWEAQAAPHFTVESLLAVIPARPALLPQVKVAVEPCGDPGSGIGCPVLGCKHDQLPES